MKNSFQAARARSIRYFFSGLVNFWRLLFVVIGLASLLLLLVSLVWPISRGAAAIAIFLLSPAILLESLALYLSYLRDHPEFLLAPGLRTNVFNRLDFESQNVLAAWNQPTLGALLAAFFSDRETEELSLRLGLQPADGAALQSQPFDEAALGELLKNAVAKADEIISVYDFFGFVLGLPAIQPLLNQKQLDAPTIKAVFTYYQSRHQQRYAIRAFWLNRLARTGGIGKTWATSYTNLLDSLTETVGPSVRQRALIWPLFGRDKIIDQMALELSKASGQNVLLVGETGIGKEELFFHFAAQIKFYQTRTVLDGQEPRLLNLQRLLAEAGEPAQLQALLDNLFGEITRANDIILWIDPIDQLLSSGQKLGQADVGNILQAHLADERVHIIGAATPEQYLKIIKPNQLLAERFSVIEVSAPSVGDLVPILLSHISQLENRYGVFFRVETLAELTQLADRYVKDEASPERELTLLEEVAAANHAHGKMVIETADVEAIIEQRAQVPLQVKQTEQKTLLHLAAELHKRVIGQNRAITQVSDALLRARAGLTTGNRPIGTFLFLGPTGVGKTETAKALAAIYFGSDQKLIRLDMTEYADANGLEKLLGTDSSSQPGALTLLIQKNPSAVVLFDEFEKAALAVKNVLLQLLDEGRLTTNYGKVLDFTNAIVIATSNAGAEYIKDQITNQTPIGQFEKPLIDKLISDRIFSPELLNRFDGVIVYAPLSPAEILQVVGLQIQLLQTQLKKDQGIELLIAPPVLQELAARGYDPVFGARALERVMKNNLETAIARQIIEQQPKPGSTLTVERL